MKFQTTFFIAPLGWRFFLSYLKLSNVGRDLKPYGPTEMSRTDKGTTATILASTQRFHRLGNIFLTQIDFQSYRLGLRKPDRFPVRISPVNFGIYFIIDWMLTTCTTTTAAIAGWIRE